MVHNILVAGAGTELVNGEYEQISPPSELSPGSWQKIGSSIKIIAMLGGSAVVAWAIADGGVSYYYAPGDVWNPWDAVWVAGTGTGAAPAPTVTPNDTPGPDPEPGETRMFIDLLTGQPILPDRKLGGSGDSGVGSINGATGDLELVDGDGNPYEMADGKIVIPQGQVRETVYQVPYPTIGTAQGTWNADTSDVTWELIAHGLTVGALISFFNLVGGATSMRDGSSYTVTEVIDADHFKAAFYPVGTILGPTQNALITADVCKLDTSEIILPALDITKKTTYYITGDIARPAAAGSITFQADAFPNPGCAARESSSIVNPQPDQSMRIYVNGTAEGTNWGTAYQFVLVAKGDQSIMAWQQDAVPFTNYVPGWMSVNTSGGWVNALPNRYNLPIKSLPGQTLSFSNVRFGLAAGVLCRNFKVVERIEV